MTKEESRKLASIAVKALEDKKAEQIEVIEIDEISPLADYFVIANGTNSSQTEAMVEAVEESAERAGFSVDHVEGHRNANWTLIDFKGVVVHVFDEEAREFYDLARIWRDGKKLNPETMEPVEE
ncbi:MAG: ribosome silencing factor [Lachnospiraceae bacterium]|nr:ribosome silencing factor [Lachnospiraceae bacterium]